VLAAASEAGRDPGQITCALNLQVRVDEHAPAGASELAGPPAAVAAQLAGFVRAGFTALNFITAGRPAGEQAERLAREVRPELMSLLPPAPRPSASAGLGPADGKGAVPAT
jgi:hypothetical protein